MEGLRHLALACCILCTLAGVIQIFWPENRYKSVINAAMVLYILSAGLLFAKDTDWRALLISLDDVAVPQPVISQEYLSQITSEATRLTLQNTLTGAGIAASVEAADGSYTIRLQNPADSERATALLRESASSLVYHLQESSDAR